MHGILHMFGATQVMRQNHGLTPYVYVYVYVYVRVHVYVHVHVYVYVYVYVYVQAMQRRYGDPTFDPYMEEEYRTLVSQPAAEASSAHAQGRQMSSAAATVRGGGAVEGAVDAVTALDREARDALPLLDR